MGQFAQSLGMQIVRAVTVRPRQRQRVSVLRGFVETDAAFRAFKEAALKQKPTTRNRKSLEAAPGALFAAQFDRERTLRSCRD